MLPDPLSFDRALVAGEPRERVQVINETGRQLAALAERHGRARALLALALKRASGATYAQVAETMQISRSRAEQLVRDGRLWEAEDGTT